MEDYLDIAHTTDTRCQQTDQTETTGTSIVLPPYMLK